MRRLIINDSGCAHQSDHFNDNDDYNLAPSDFDHYQEDLEFKNGGTGIEEDTVMDQRDQNMRDSSMQVQARGVQTPRILAQES